MSLATTILSPGLAALQIGQGVSARAGARDFADAIVTAGEDRVQERIRAGVLRRGNIRSAAAASGVTVGVGSNYEALVADVFHTAMDAERIRFQFGARAARAEAEGEAAFTEGILGGTLSILGGADSILDTPFDFGDDGTLDLGPSETLPATGGYGDLVG